MALHVAAQDKVKLSGRVIDDEQNPVLFAVVKVDGQAAGTTTDLQGRYQLEFSTADTVTVSFSMIGYVTKKKTLVRPKGSLRLNITLQTQSIDMGEVTVKEVRRQMNSTQHLNAENLKRLPSTTGNAVEELVATQAGVSTHNELSSQYNVRGGSFDENSVYINGVEVYRPMLISSGQQEGLSVINSDMVESINFSAGGFDAKYGDKMSSVLDITYKKPKKFEASVSASLLGAGQKELQHDPRCTLQDQPVYVGVVGNQRRIQPAFPRLPDLYQLVAQQTLEPGFHREHLPEPI